MHPSCSCEGFGTEINEGGLEHLALVICWLGSASVVESIGQVLRSAFCTEMYHESGQDRGVAAGIICCLVLSEEKEITDILSHKAHWIILLPSTMGSNC